MCFVLDCLLEFIYALYNKFILILIARYTHSSVQHLLQRCSVNSSENSNINQMAWARKDSDHQLHCFQTMRLTSTEASILKVVMSLTTEDGQWISITLLWILISYLSQVLVPSPHGDFLVVILKILVGILTGPLVSYPLFLALTMISLQAHSSGLISLPLRVILKRANKVRRTKLTS